MSIRRRATGVARPQQRSDSIQLEHALTTTEGRLPPSKWCGRLAFDEPRCPRDPRFQLSVSAVDPLSDRTAHRLRRPQRCRKDQPLSRAAIAAGGGMQSALWAGRRRAGQPARIVLTAGFGEASSSNDVTAEAIQSYQVEAGV